MHDDHRHEDRRHPGSREELRDQNNDQRRSGGKRAKAVEEHLYVAMFFGLELDPMPGHTGLLRPMKASEGADGVESGMRRSVTPSKMMRMTRSETRERVDTVVEEAGGGRAMGRRAAYSPARRWRGPCAAKSAKAVLALKESAARTAPMVRK